VQTRGGDEFNRRSFRRSDDGHCGRHPVGLDRLADAESTTEDTSALLKARPIPAVEALRPELSVLPSAPMAGFEMKHHLLATFGALLAVVHLLAQAPETGPFDLVVANSRVMDPESNTDAIRHVGITGGVVHAISRRLRTAGKRIAQGCSRSADGCKAAITFSAVGIDGIPPWNEPASVGSGRTKAEWVVKRCEHNDAQVSSARRYQA
jgi:hypothetical protein